MRTWIIPIECYDDDTLLEDFLEQAFQAWVEGEQRQASTYQSAPLVLSYVTDPARPKIHGLICNTAQIQAKTAGAELWVQVNLPANFKALEVSEPLPIINYF